MGAPKRRRRLYRTPVHPWQKARLDEEREIVGAYGLRNKRELWRAEGEPRKYRRDARNLLAEFAARADNETTNKKKDEIVNKLRRYGVLKGSADPLDEVLSLDVKRFLDRRLQTIVYKKGLANSPKQSRQLIVHGHIAVEGRRITIPSYLVEKDEEEKVSYDEGAPMKVQNAEAV